MQCQDSVHTGDDLAQAVEDERCYATCSPPSVQGQGLGFDHAQVGRSYKVNGCDTRSGIPQPLLGETGRLTGRYVVPSGCGRHAARWEVRIPGDTYIWIEVDL